MDLAAEHDLVDLGRDHDEAFHIDTEHQARDRADEREQQRLAVDIGIDLVRLEAEDLQGRDLAHALGDVDVRQVVEHHEGKKRGGDHYDFDAAYAAMQSMLR